MSRHQSTEYSDLKGIPVSPGIIIGKAHLVDRSRVKILYQYLIKDKQLDEEVSRFKRALSVTEKQFSGLKKHLPRQAKEQGFILDSHLMMLRDGKLTDSTIKKILEEKINAEWALKKTLEEIRQIFEQIQDEYISRRIEDVENVTERILRNLSGEEQDSLADIDERVIIVAHDLSPADTTELNTSKVMGFITDVGGRTSHTAIMAQALEIPAVIGLESATSHIRDKDLLIVDGNSGIVIINPDDAAIIEYQEKQLRYEKYRSSIARKGHLPAETTDGHKISVQANIEFLEEVAAVKNNGGEGIGLYRTEFLYLRGKGIPPEEELFEDYREVAEIIAPYPVTIRTLDIGGDKFASDFEIAGEMNPALGLRAIRLCLKEPGIFKSQLRAIFRASIYGSIQLMFPMISGLQEILEAKAIMEEVRHELDREKKEYDPDLKIGAMIEVPSAVTMAEVLAEHVDFFSIGTNDLIQYALAIDRVNEHVAYMYQPFHPAILRMIRQVVDAADNAGISVSLCGEMAGDPTCVPCLIGMGISTLSTNSRAIPLIKDIIRSISLEQARADFKEVMKLNTAKEVREHIFEKVRDIVPDLIRENYGKKNSMPQ
jgi:phosphotransferase system enzyme I (PtsI)